METEKTGVIYRIYHKGSMKSYIGKSIRPNERLREHLNGYSHNTVLRRAIKKYGVDAFCVEILESNMPESQLAKLEILHIRFFNSKTPNGYNFTDGGEGMSGWEPTSETRRRSSEARIGEKNHFYGKRHSPETRQKISDSMKGKHKGKPLSAAHRQKLSEAKKGQIPWIKGKEHSPDTRRKISEANKGKKHSPEARKKLSEAGKGRIPWNKGETGVYSDETRRKISEANKGKTPWIKGKTHYAETRKKLSEANKGKKLSPEHRRKISESNKNPSQDTRQKKSKAHKGKPHSPETRRKISESLKRRNRSA